MILWLPSLPSREWNLRSSVGLEQGSFRYSFLKKSSLLPILSPFRFVCGCGQVSSFIILSTQNWTKRKKNRLWDKSSCIGLFLKDGMATLLGKMKDTHPTLFYPTHQMLTGAVWLKSPRGRGKRCEDIVTIKRVNYGNILSIQNHTSCDRTTPLRVNKARHGSRNFHNLVILKTTKPESTLPKITPNCTALNAHSLVKPDATSGLSTGFSSNKIDICIVSETWLNSRVSSHVAYPDGYTILRTNRRNQRTGGIVALILTDD